jgi:hypothetical protein
MVELKVVSSGKKIRLSPHQAGFHLKHAAMGCPTFILVEYHPPPSSGEKPQILLYEGKSAADIVDHGIDAKSALRGCMSLETWSEVYRVLSKAVE